MKEQRDNIIDFDDYKSWRQFKKLPTWQDPVLRRMNQLSGKAEAAMADDLIEQSEKTTIQDLIEQMRQLYFEVQSFERYIERLRG